MGDFMRHVAVPALQAVAIVDKDHANGAEAGGEEILQRAGDLVGYDGGDHGGGGFSRLG